MANIFDIKEVKGNCLYCDINGESFRFGRAEGVRKSDERNVAHCGEWNYNDCWIVYGMNATLDANKYKHNLYGIENSKLKKIKIIS